MKTWEDVESGDGYAAYHLGQELNPLLKILTQHGCLYWYLYWYMYMYSEDIEITSTLHGSGRNRTFRPWPDSYGFERLEPLCSRACARGLDFAPIGKATRLFRQLDCLAARTHMTKA